MNLYSILRIRSNASIASIRKAFHRRSKETHPDRNPGKDTSAEFQQVMQAWRVLSDPERKARYDATGEYEERPDNRNATLIPILQAIFRHVAGERMKAGVDLAYTDLVDLMRSEIRQQLVKMSSQKREAGTAKAKLADISKRFGVASGENLLGSLAEADIAEVEKQIQQLDAQAKQFEEVLEYLKGCTFRKDDKVFSEGSRVRLEVSGSNRLWR